MDLTDTVAEDRSMKFGKRRAIYRVKKEEDLWSLPLVYVPYSGLVLNVQSWSEEKNKRIQEYLEPEFLECGCLFARMVMLGLLCVNLVLFITLNGYYQDLLEWLWFAILSTFSITVMTKTAVVVLSRMMLLNKLYEVKTGLLFQDQISVNRFCNCNK